MPHRKTRTIRALLTLAGAATALTLGACGGHGKYTQEHLNRAQERMAELKSGTEWDLARQAFLSGDLDKAEKLVDTSIGLNNDVAKSHVLRGRIMLEMGRMDEAIASLSHAAELDPEHVDSAYYLGVVFERLLERETALTHYTRAAELDQTDPQYGVAAAEVLIDLDRPEEARAFLQEREEFYRHAPGVRQTLAHIAMMTDDHELAVELFTEAQLLAPEDNGILEDLIWAQVETERYGDAEYNLARLMESDDHVERRDLRHLHVRCLMELDRPVEARAALDELVSGDDGAGDVSAWLSMGRVAVQLDDQGRLREASRRVVSLAPRRPEGHFLRALWLYRLDRPGQALPAAKEAVRLDPQNAEYAILQGMVQQKLGRREDAVASYTRAVSIDPSNPLARHLVDQPMVSPVTAAPTN